MRARTQRIEQEGKLTVREMQGSNQAQDIRGTNKRRYQDEKAEGKGACNKISLN